MKILVTGGSGFIGTNLVDHLARRGCELLNLDVSEPHIRDHRTYWRQCNILDCGRLESLATEFQPSHVIHLAARTDMAGNDVEDYRVNTEGTTNVVKVVQNLPRIAHFVHTSTQYVLRPGLLPQDDEDFQPHTAYGESKARSEQIVRAGQPGHKWTIIRPTNIWGPWHPRYPYEFWRVLSRGLYLHPRGKSVIRGYGYIGNVIFQIRRILELPPELVHARVYYVGDRLMQLLEWVNAFSRALCGRDVRIVRRRYLQALALGGDVCHFFGFKFPIYSSRLRSMTEDYPVPMERTFAVVGESPYSLESGVRETVDWLKCKGYIRRSYG